MPARNKDKGKLFVIGIGPGDLGHLSHKAKAAIDSCQAVVGYKRYLQTIAPILNDQDVYSFGMRREKARCQKAIDLALAGQHVALVSSGDPGIYGMAGLTLELLSKLESAGLAENVSRRINDEAGLIPKDKLEVEIIPGISALNYAAALLGAPIGHDFAVISLSDLLTPWELITAKIEAAAEADFIIVFYNPKSRKRQHQIKEARDICLKFREETNPVGIVRWDGEKPVAEITDLKNMCGSEIDMMTTVIIGNSATVVSDERLITPRGYRL